MLNRIKKLLASPGPVAEPQEEQERIQVATCVILLEMAAADSDFHEMEGMIIRDLLQEKFELSAEAVSELITCAQQAREASLDIHQFTREVNENFTREEKLEIMEVLWRIVYADGVLDKFEDYLVRKLAELLRLSHREMIDVKVKVLDAVSPERRST